MCVCVCVCVLRLCVRVRVSMLLAEAVCVCARVRARAYVVCGATGVRDSSVQPGKYRVRARCINVLPSRVDSCTRAVCLPCEKRHVCATPLL